MNTLMDRLFSAGLSNPSEKTVQTIVAMLAALDNPGADPHALWSMVQAVKASMQGRRGLTSKGFTDFPTDAKNLPKALYDQAYPDPEAGPVARDIRGMHSLLSRIPMRHNNKLLKPAQQLVPAAAAHSAPSAPSNLQDPTAFFMQCMQGFLNGRMPQQQPVIHFTTPKRNEKPELSALPSALYSTPPRPSTPMDPAWGLSTTSPQQPAALSIAGAAGGAAGAAGGAAGAAGGAAGAAGGANVGGKDDEDPDGEPSDGEDEDLDDVAKHEHLAKAAAGKGKGKGKAKAKGKPKAKGKAKAAPKSKAKAKAKAKGKAAAKKTKDGYVQKRILEWIGGKRYMIIGKTKYLMGCSRCKFGSAGCSLCWKPTYKGLRKQVC